MFTSEMYKGIHKGALMKKILFAFTVFSAVFASGGEALPTANNVDVARYIGKWYAVSSLPQFFTRTCVGQTAEYGIINAKTISVLNTCIKRNGRTTDIEGQAVITDPATNARLLVTFNNFFTKLFRVKGEYVIIKLSEGYDTVLVGTTNRKSMWILSRIPNIDPEVLAEYKLIAKNLGFNVQKLVDSKF
jgi:apolipoprotein D and lipocalin family protein